MLEDIGPWDFKFDEDVEELIRIEPDGTIRIDDLVMDAEELVRRIRATEALSAEDAMVLAVGMNVLHNYVPFDVEKEALQAHGDRLEAYARARQIESDICQGGSDSE